MLDQLLALDRELFIFLNSLHKESLDPVMYYASQTKVWIPLYLLIGFFIIKHYRNDSWAPLLGLLVTIVIADQVASTLMKPFFERLRPTHEPSLQAVVHTVYNYRGGKYGFASSHAANVFGAGFFIWLVFKPRPLWIVLWFCWAAAVSYTRIYLGVHYPLDILTGAVVGLLAAFAGRFTWQKLSKIRIRSEAS
jgi:undecaprenyl-diphosphatase